MHFFNFCFIVIVIAAIVFVLDLIFQNKKRTKEYIDYKKFTSKSVDIAKARVFINIWKAQVIELRFDADKFLNDDEFILYNMWMKEHRRTLFEQYMPKVKYVEEINYDIHFNIHCVPCKSKKIHGVNFCKGCRFFRSNADLPDLSCY